jgi:hypothetical protein
MKSWVPQRVLWLKEGKGGVLNDPAKKKEYREVEY